jgi:hypothetical protein
MSVSTEVQRTLVKSPPELWSELSNSEALGRHLADLGEIRITSVEPETKVEWETEGASGIVQLKQSGWGTKVTLSVTREAPVSDEQSELIADAEPEPSPESVGSQSKPIAAEPMQIAEPVEPGTEPVTTEPRQVAQRVVEPVESKAEPVAREPEQVAELVEPEHEWESPLVAEPKRGLFARLFRRRGAKPVEIVELEPETKLQPISDAEPESESEPELKPEPELKALAAPEPIYPQRPIEPAVDLATELESVEAQMAQETTELLTGVLDRLGAAHHRPFSRG